MAAKRIYQIAKEFERDEKEIIDFLTEQGIKVGNRLSAVSDDTYNLLKAKYTAPPEPPPAPEPPPPPPEPEKPAPDQQPDAQGEQVPGQPGKKKKKKNKQPQGEDGEQLNVQPQAQPVKQPGMQIANVEGVNAVTQAVYKEAIQAGNDFIEDYRHGGMTKKALKSDKVKLMSLTDTWSVLCSNKFDNPDSSPIRYWQAVNKLTTRAFKLINMFGMEHREGLAAMRNTLYPVGLGYEPREIFTAEENQLFEQQQTLLFKAFGHGMGAINDRLYDLKMHAERMKAKYEHMDFVEYVSNPLAELRSPNRPPFVEITETITHNISGIARRFYFFGRNKDRIENIVKNFFEWLDGYAKLKEQGAPAEKIAKYLELEKKFIVLVDFFSFDNLLEGKKDKLKPFDLMLNFLNEYRDNMDDPDAERNFKYKVRGVTNLTYKPKEYVFIYQFGGLEPHKDYRPPEEIAAAKAKAAENNEELEIRNEE